jgi:Bacteriophage holin.
MDSQSSGSNKFTEIAESLTSEDATKMATDIENIVQVAKSHDSQPKYKSWLLWASIASLVVIFIRLFYGSNYSDFTDNLINVVMAVLSAVGIINNPNSKTTI